MATKSDIGKIGWMDLTVDDAESVLEFYKSVVGWTSTKFSLGEYDDYCVSPPADENPVAGICHKLGLNVDVPSQWLMYVTVANLEVSMRNCESLGGKVITRDRDMGSHGRMSIIQDPAGAICAIVQPLSFSDDD